MSTFNFKTATPDVTFPSGGFLFGADSQSAATPSIYAGTTYLAYILGLANTWTANGTVSAPVAQYVGTWYSGGTETTTKPFILIEPTGTTSTGWSTSGTVLGINAPTSFLGRLLDCQQNGVSNFYLRYDGVLTSTKKASFGGLSLGENGSGAITVRATGIYGWSNDTSGQGSYDLSLFRDAANVLALRNSTDAQTQRIYGTYTDDSNYRRVAIAMTTAGVASITPEGAGTGASGNVLHISGLPTSNPGPGILWNNAGTPAIGT